LTFSILAARDIPLKSNKNGIEVDSDVCICYHVQQRVHFVGVASQLVITSSMGRTRKLVKESVLSTSYL